MSLRDELADIHRQTAARARKRVRWVATTIAVAFVVVAGVCLFLIEVHFSRFHSGWREAVPEVIQDFAWLPVLGIAWWLKTRIENFLNGG